MSRDYAHEDWIPWYVEDTAGWLDLSLAARGAAEGIARQMGRDRDELPLGSRGLRGLDRVLGCKWEELEPALRELFSPGPDGEPPRLVHDQERNCVRDPQAKARRRPTSTARVHKLRGKVQSTETFETPETVTRVSKRGETGVTVSSPSDLLSSKSSSKDLPDRLPTPSRFSAGVTGQEALARYAKAVATATNRKFTLGRAPFFQADLCDLLNEHGPPGLAPALDWLEATITDWVVKDPGCNGWKPSQLLDWLNADKPDRRRRQSAADITKQPFDENAPWMKVGS